MNRIDRMQHITYNVAKLDALSAETKKLEAIYAQKLADLDEMKKSILAKAFKGELTEVSIWCDKKLHYELQQCHPFHLG